MEKKLHVVLLRYTPEAETLIASAAKLCYSPSDIDSLLERQTPEKSRECIDKLALMGHQSPLEHVSYTFGIEGISRACSHQLVRHRIASFSQQSQRYVGELSGKNPDGCFDFIIPPSVEKAGMKKRFIEMIKSCQEFYDEISQALKKSGLEGEANFQDARFILPNAAETKIIASMNARELLHFFRVRCCNRAQWEIRNLAKEMYRVVLPTVPYLFKYTGPSCVSTGKCSEGKMSCGLAEQVREEFKRLGEQSDTQI